MTLSNACLSQGESSLMNMGIVHVPALLDKSQSIEEATTILNGYFTKTSTTLAPIVLP